MCTREHYEKLFADYPDLVRIQQFRTMLGGVTEATALKILEQGRIKFYFIRRRHLIPKVCVIDYLMGIDHSSQ
ncbi:MAG: DNA-binding protein, partial [Candidatus Faecousia sp.]|nr:DNA-binding protein [Candidatus Faecousia sp.]